LDRRRFGYGRLFLKFLAHRGNWVTHFPDNALQIVSGYAKLPFQASTLAGVSQVNLVANGLRLGAAHLGRLPWWELIAFADDSFRDCHISGQGRSYFVDNPHFISEAMRSLPASPSASLRRCPSGSLRVSAITSVARASQSWLCADRTVIRPGGDPIIMLCPNSESPMRAVTGDCLMAPMALNQFGL
jgi:hypothetical protein